MLGSRSMTLHRVRLVTLLVLTAAMLAAPAVAIPEQKRYTADVSPHSVAAGSLQTYSLTVTNMAISQQMGSLNLTTPNPSGSFALQIGSGASSHGTATVVDAANDRIEARNLSLPAGGVATITFVAEAPCLAGVYSWGIIAKQSNNFAGPPGNNFTLDVANSNLSTTVTGSCSLNFSAPPGIVTKVSQTITDDVLSSGGPVLVEVRGDSSTRRVVDAQGSTASITLSIHPDHNPGATTLDGTTTVAAADGVASFDDLSIGVHGRLYRLLASSTEPGVGPGTSPEFDIHDGGGFCDGGPCGPFKHTAGPLEALISVPDSDPGAYAVVSIGILDGLDCPTYDEPVEEEVTVLYSGSQSSVLVVNYDKSIVDRPASAFESCLGKDSPFTTKDGSPAQFVPDLGFYVGLAPTCNKTHTNIPCLDPPKKTKLGVTLTIFLAPGDPFHK